MDLDPPPDQPSSSRGPIAALAVIALLLFGGLWLMRVLGNAATVQDCLASGRTNCAPVAATRP